MPDGSRAKQRYTLFVLHPVFALTGVVQAIGGSLLPSMAAHFHLVDRQSGLLFLFFFAGSSLGAVFCRRNYARSLALSFLLMAGCCLGISLVSRPLLPAVFFLFGISNGIPMSAVNLLVGRSFPERCAPLLTFLNFSWSAGALAAPLMAARVLVHHDFRAAYLLLAGMAAAAALACALLLEDAAEAPRIERAITRGTQLRLILLFAFAGFLQVGVENTAVTWLASYLLRMTGTGAVQAAAASSLYFAGFLVSRGLSSLVLLRADATKVLRFAVLTSLAAGLLLFVLPSAGSRNAAMVLLGASLAPIYPLLIASFFARARQSSDTRWILATAGFGGSVLPWIAGWISSHTGSLRMGMLTIPAALALMTLLLPVMRPPQAESRGTAAT
ncbi:MAG: MFS transporter [Terracidiphilus sp.]